MLCTKKLLWRIAVQFIGQHFVLKPLAITDFTGCLYALQESQIAVDNTQTLAIFAGTFGVETKQRSADLVGCREGFAKGEQLYIASKFKFASARAVDLEYAFCFNVSFSLHNVKLEIQNSSNAVDVNRKSIRSAYAKDV